MPLRIHGMLDASRFVVALEANRKSEFFQAVWNIWNWTDITSGFEAAKRTEAAVRGGAI